MKTKGFYFALGIGVTLVLIGCLSAVVTESQTPARFELIHEQTDSNYRICALSVFDRQTGTFNHWDKNNIVTVYQFHQEQPAQQ